MELERLARCVASGQAILFTGAGFSMDARSAAGHPVPSSDEMRRDLWQLLCGDDAPDDSSLADLYDVALLEQRDALARYVAERLAVAGPLPPYYQAWFAAPWRRAYTLNVDNLELAIAAQFPLPRPVRALSVHGPPPAPFPGLDVIHLNGLVGDDVGVLTFSTLQYAGRLCGRDPAYETLVHDFASAPFVFVGTRLDEAVLWKHMELRRQRDGDGALAATPAFLVSKHLSRARQRLLAAVGIEWVAATAEAVAACLPR